MRKYLEMVGLIVTLLGAAVELIKSFEVPGFGKEKKGIVMQMLKTVFAGLVMKVKNLDVVWEEIEGLISGAIDNIVGFFNMVNIFKKEA